MRLTWELPGGRYLRLPSAGELLQARREAAALTREPGERPLCSNACLVARCLWAGDRPVFESGAQVLGELTAEEIGELAARWDSFRRNAGAQEQVEQGFNPNFDSSRMGGGA